LQAENHLLNQIVAQLKFAAQKCISNESKHLTELCSTLPLLAKQRIQREHYELSLLEQTIALAHPQRILNMGYSIVRKQGKSIGSTADLALGEQLSITLKDGSIDTIVTRI
jgi:exodeoxyribonuclease VII large subunit